MINDMASLRTAVAGGRRPLLLFSGGLDGAYLIAMLRCHDLVALTVELGGDPLQPEVQQVCSHAGVRLERVDARKQFITQYVFPAITCQARYAGGHPICASLSRPLIATIAIARARELGCGVIVHTSNPSQNSLRRFNGALARQGFDGEFGSPFTRDYVSREDKSAALAALGFPGYGRNVVSIDTNAWGREFEFGSLDDPEDIDVSPALYLWTSEERRVTESELLSVHFSNGRPTRLNGADIDGLTLISRLNEIVGRHGLGRYIGLEETQSGAKVQEVREMPAAHLLLDAYRRLEAACVPYDCIREKLHVEQTWTREAVEGRWFGPLRSACHAFVDSVASGVSGEVSYLLSSNRLELRSLRAEKPLYVRDRRLLERQ